MKSRTSTCITAMTLFAALAIPVRFAAQDDTAQANKPKHHRYTLIDMGTFGGPQSYIAIDSQVLNQDRAFVGWADTPTPDPYPGFCFNPDCFVSHAFRWHEGLCIAKIKNARIGFRGDYFQRMGIGLRASGRTASGGGRPAVLRAELAVGMWLFVALKETNRKVQFFPQKLTQAASV